MEIIGQGMYFQQQRPKNWGQLPIGATLGDELGGVGYIGADGSNTENKEVAPTEDDDKIFGMTKKQLATGIVVGILGGLALYYGYKHFTKKATV